MGCLQISSHLRKDNLSPFVQRNPFWRCSGAQEMYQSPIN
jgi:hypothetical protein